MHFQTSQIVSVSPTSPYKCYSPSDIVENIPAPSQREIIIIIIIIESIALPSFVSRPSRRFRVRLQLLCVLIYVYGKHYDVINNCRRLIAFTVILRSIFGCPPGRNNKSWGGPSRPTCKPSGHCTGVISSTYASYRLKIGFRRSAITCISTCDIIRTHEEINRKRSTQ